MSRRVAMVAACPYPVPQGSQVLLRDTALALHGAGHEMRLVVYGYGVGEDSSGLPVHHCARIPGACKTAAGPSFAKPVLDALLVMALRRVVREQEIDIVHAHNYEGLMVALAARTRPIVYHAHNAMADELPHFLSPAPLARRLGAWLDRTFPRRAHHVIAPHQALADYLIACGCDPARVSVIPPPLDPAPFLAEMAGREHPPALRATPFKGGLELCANTPREPLSPGRFEDAAPRHPDAFKPSPKCSDLSQISVDDGLEGDGGSIPGVPPSALPEAQAEDQGFSPASEARRVCPSTFSAASGSGESSTANSAYPAPPADSDASVTDHRSPFEEGGTKCLGMSGSSVDSPILYTGNLDAYQNLGLLREAMACVRKQNSAARLVIATATLGAAGLFPDAEHVPTPDLDSLCRVLAQDAVVVCPRTSWCGYPMKLLNAMAAGRPIVACQSAAHPITDGHDGLIVPDDDPETFAAAILRLLDDAPLRAALGAHARETIATRHRPEAIAAQIEAVYAGLG